MNALIAVFLGGAVGGLLRALLTEGWPGYPAALLPWSTLAANVIGSFIIGWLAAHTAGRWGEAVRLALSAGFCGGFTTVSLFSWQVVLLATDGQWERAAVYALVTPALGILAAAFGSRVGRRAHKTAGEA
jgi:fluoride exporter